MSTIEKNLNLYPARVVFMASIIALLISVFFVAQNLRATSSGETFVVADVDRNPQGTFDGTVTMITYNIAGATPNFYGDPLPALNKLADFIVAQDADIVGLQEVDKGTNRHNNVDIPAEILQLLEQRNYPMNGRFANRFDVDGGEFGNMVLSRYPIQNYQSLVLAPQEIAQTFTVIANDHNFRVFNYHPFPKNSCTTINPFEDAIAAYPNDMIFLLGDFNALNSSPCLNDIKANFWNSCDFSPDESCNITVDATYNPAGSIGVDFVFVKQGVLSPYTDPWEVLTVFSDHDMNLGVPVSDHFPVTAILGYTDGAVPVELVSFGATAHESEVILQWVTATESNNYGFEIERSSAGTMFNRIGFVAGHGTTVVPKSYIFVDRDIQKARYYYRLKQIDFDGSYSYSNVLELVLEAPSTFRLQQNFPNPFNPSTTITYSIPSLERVMLDIFTLRGEYVINLVNKVQEAGNYLVNWNGRNQHDHEAASGVYIARLKTERISKAITMIKIQ